MAESAKELVTAVLGRAKAYDEKAVQRAQEARAAKRAAWRAEWAAEMNALSPADRVLVEAQLRREMPGIYSVMAESA